MERTSRDAEAGGAGVGGDKVVNERGLSRVLRLYKVGSEGLTEVL